MSAIRTSEVSAAGQSRLPDIDQNPRFAGAASPYGHHVLQLEGTVCRFGFETAWTSSSRTLNLAMRQGGKSLLISK